MKLEFDITKVSIVALSGPDEICLDLATPVHGEYEKWNTSALYVRTARGNGEACLHKLGWRGKYTYITSVGAETRVLEDWHYREEVTGTLLEADHVHANGDLYERSALEEATQKYNLQREIAMDTGEPVVTVENSKSVPWIPTQKQTAWMLAEILRLRTEVADLKVKEGGT